MRVRSSMLCCTVAGGLVLLAVPASAAAPAAVACGDVITGDAVLTADLVCPGEGPALTLTDGATLDLAGHRLRGDGTGWAIQVPANGAVTIRGGTVQRWRTGIVNESDSRNAGPVGVTTIDRMTFRDNDHGVWAFGLIVWPPEIDVTASRFVGNRVGIYGLQSRRISVASSRFTDNGVGVAMTEGVGHAEVTGSVFAHNTYGLGCGQDVSCSVVDSTLRDNGTGVDASYGSAYVAGSVLARNDVGATASYGHLTLEGNEVRDNGTGVSVYGSGRLVDNRFLRNGVGFSGSGQTEYGDTASLTGNEFRRNGDGMLVTVADWASLERNTAVRNERWGIHAPGAIDLGGNTARGNGNEPQCVGVVCGAPGPGPVS